MYNRKTVDRWDIMGNYGYGWDCECSEYTYKEARQQLKTYRENGGGSYRLEIHRERTPNVKGSIKGQFIDCCYNGDYGAYRKARNADYHKVQLEWSFFIDSLCKAGEITQHEYDSATF